MGNVSLSQLINDSRGIDNQLDKILKSLSEDQPEELTASLYDLKSMVADLQLELQEQQINFLNSSFSDSRAKTVRLNGTLFINDNGGSFTEKTYNEDFMSMLAPAVRYNLVIAFKDWYIDNKKEFPALFDMLLSNNGVLPSADFA
jgi:hypothetical protein